MLIPARRAALAAVVLMALVAGCGDDVPATTGAPTTTLPGAATPAEAAEAWFDAVGEGRPDEAAGLLVDDQLALLVAVENELDAGQLAELLEGGVPAGTTRDYWASFAESFEDFAGDPIENLTAGDVREFAVDGRKYAAVGVALAPGAGSTTLVVAEVGGRWRVDLLATLAPALVTQMRVLATSAGESAVQEALVGQIPSLRAAVEQPAPAPGDAVLRELEALIRFLAPALDG